MREALRSGKEEVQAGNNQLRPRPRSPQRKAVQCGGQCDPLWSGEDPLYGPRRQKGSGSALEPQLWRLITRGHEARRERSQQCQAVTAQLLRTALVSVIYQVVPLGCTLGKVYLC